MKHIRKFNEELKDINTKITGTLDGKTLIRTGTKDFFEKEKINKIRSRVVEIKSVMDNLKFIVNDNNIEISTNSTSDYLNLSFIIHKFPILDEHMDSVEEFMDRLRDNLSEYRIEKTGSKLGFRIFYPTT